MYDFHFGTRDKISGSEEDFLLFVKRLLPRWANSIPDSEYLSIHAMATRAVEGIDRPVLVETGSGASTLALVHVAMKSGGTLFSWDTNGSKGSFLRGVIADALEPYHRASPSQHWQFVGFSSISPYLGVPVLKELGHTVDFAFLDSEHTLDVLLSEVRALSDQLRPGSVVVIDDANLDWQSVNFAFVNMFRAKLGLAAVNPPQGARGKGFAVAVADTLRECGWTPTPFDNDYAERCRDDIYFAYYSGERAAMHEVEMEKGGDLEARMAAYQVDR